MYIKALAFLIVLIGVAIFISIGGFFIWLSWQFGFAPAFNLPNITWINAIFIFIGLSTVSHLFKPYHLKKGGS